MDKQEISTYLTEKKQELEQRIRAISNDFHKGRSQDFAEQATESENDEVLKEIQHEAELELQQVTSAIGRLAIEQYGICALCNQPISSERLSVLPYTVTCINCAE